MAGLLNAQSKKEQIEILNKRVDSLNEVVGSERKINLDKSTKISELTNTITNLESSIKSLNSDVSKLTSELQQSKTESATKTQDLANLQTQLKIKTDSLTSLHSELHKLKNEILTNQSLLKNNSIEELLIDGQTYKTVKIGNQTWMAENLNVSTFRNGDPITEAKNIDEWIKADKNKQPAWCYYDNDPKNGLKYGKLYNWHAVKDHRGLADKGWHVPSDEEWKQLTDYLGGESVAGNKMKYTNFWDHYECESGNGTNESGFSGLPGGLGGQSGLERFDFDFVGNVGYWWSSTEYDTTSAWHRTLICDTGSVGKDSLGKYYMISVRCLRD